MARHGGRGRSSCLRDADQLHPDAARLSIVPAGHPMGYQDAFTAFVADVYAAIGRAGARGPARPSPTDSAPRGITEAVLDSAAAGRWDAIATSTDDEQRITA